MSTAVVKKWVPSTESQPLKCGDAIVSFLRKLDVTQVFGVPGGSIEPFFDAVARASREAPIEMVVARHESGAAFMADGYARERRKIGVCCSTTGPGATNLMTGVSSAYVDNIPMLVITAQTPMPKFGRKALQDSSCSAVDLVGMFKHCTKYSSLVSHADQIIPKLIAAVQAANAYPKGPVHLSFPADLINQPLSFEPDYRLDMLTDDYSLVDLNALDKLLPEIVQAKKIALFLGDNCEGASEEIIRFAERVNATIISGPMGKRWVNEYHPQYAGVFGFSGHAKARRLVMDQQYDLMIAIGAKLSEIGTNGWEAKLINEKLIHIDSIQEHFCRSGTARLHVLGGLTSIFKQLNERLAKLARMPWQATRPLQFQESLFSEDENALCEGSHYPIKPQRLYSSLAKMLPEDSRVFIDAGNAWAWATRYFQRRDNLGRYRIAMGYGSMTWAIGASVGSCVANPSSPHLCITGDGSYLMSGQEITVALQQNIPLVMLVVNDNSLGMVKHGQRLGGAEQIGYELPQINFAAIAESMGIEGIVIDTVEQLDQLDFSRLFSKQQPTLLDVRIDAEEVPPMGERVKGLATSKNTCE
ncbi:thiamine pyrophosphate-binding protein [uncultured Neptuniibacter sp.]|uniref:thiamine pyrophosphate-binding protein n=1 Tax=uncultured Neptuniibacter sp. TaxID=502143 RepID=UPI00262C176E|nr:thiamine pyrophosphate-binding protein [uncultured Neptuniibacter sp.]